jgi:hypothetical protein
MAVSHKYTTESAWRRERDFLNKISLKIKEPKNIGKSRKKA